MSSIRAAQESMRDAKNLRGQQATQGSLERRDAIVVGCQLKGPQRGGMLSLISDRLFPARGTGEHIPPGLG